MSAMDEAHPASWYLAQGIKDIESIPPTFRELVAHQGDEADQRYAELDRRIRILDTKYNEVLGVMHELGDRIQRATDALIASTKH